MPLIYKPYQATLANKEGQKLYYPRLVKFGKMVNTQKMAELIAEKASLTAGDVHNVIRNLMSVMREQLLNSRTVRLEGLGTFTMTQLYTLMYQTKYLILYYQLQGKIKPTYLRNRSVLK